MRKLCLLLICALLGPAFAQQTLTIPAPVCTALVSCQSSAVTLPAPTVTPPPVATPPPVVTPPPVTPPPVMPAGTFWVYHNGAFNWLGDYSWDGLVNYSDTTGVPMDGNFDIAFTLQAKWGGFQPFDIASGQTGSKLGFDTSKYKSLHYCTKPTKAGQIHGTGIDANNDVADGVLINVNGDPGSPSTKYGPMPVVGVWGCYNIPLADFKLTNPLIMKFSITDGAGLLPNEFFIDDVGFAP